MTLYTHQESNIRKTWFLITLFFVGIIALGWVFAQAYNDSTILYVAVALSLVMNVTSYWFSDKIALAMNGSHEASREEFAELHRIVETLAITAGLPKPRVYVINDTAPNAFATGRNKEHAVVAVTTGLMQILDRSELEGVIAHELSHIGNRDILLSTVVVVLAGSVAIISDLFLRVRLFGGRDRDSKAGAIILIISLVAAILAPIAATMIRLAISRKREFLADASGALLTRYPEGLASALQKISSRAQPLKRANNATAHLFIANPFGRTGGITKLFMTHPPVEERIKALRGNQI